VHTLAEQVAGRVTAMMAAVFLGLPVWWAREQRRSRGRNSDRRFCLCPRLIRFSWRACQKCCCDQNWQSAFQSPACVCPTRQSAQSPCSRSRRCSCCPSCRCLSCVPSAGTAHTCHWPGVTGRGLVRCRSCALARQCCCCCCCSLVRASGMDIEASIRLGADRSRMNGRKRTCGLGDGLLAVGTSCLSGRRTVRHLGGCWTKRWRTCCLWRTGRARAACCRRPSRVQWPPRRRRGRGSRAGGLALIRPSSLSRCPRASHHRRRFPVSGGLC
jgi:hypothetical protein